MARGIKFGRKPKLTLHQIQEARARREAGGMPDRHRSVLQRLALHNIPALRAASALGEPRDQGRRQTFEPAGLQHRGPKAGRA
jgi:hypothetical protein